MWWEGETVAAVLRSQECQSHWQPDAPAPLSPAAATHGSVPQDGLGALLQAVVTAWTYKWHFGPFLGGGGFWQLYPMQRVCWAPRMPKRFHAARCDGSLQRVASRDRRLLQLLGRQQ